jgi:hypothetical protein
MAKFSVAQRKARKKTQTDRLKKKGWKQPKGAK